MLSLTVNYNTAALCPILAVMLSAVLSYLIGRKSERARDIFASLVALGAAVYFGVSLFCKTGADAAFGMTEPTFALKTSPFNVLYAFITSVMWFVTTAFSTPYFRTYDERNRYYLFSLLTFGATIGVFLSATLLTLFIFFEIMSFTSYVMVVHDRKPETLKAASTYLTVSVVGGMSILMGLCIFAANSANTPLNTYAAVFFMLVGFGAKAGAFPLHVWLPKAHPAAPAPASALLSGVLTKTGIYGILMMTATLFGKSGMLEDRSVSWGNTLLFLGVVTMLLGGILALLSVNLKRTLACSSMSQIGFILVGISMQTLLGEHSAIAAGGTVLHMVNHSMIKLVLFVCAGIIYMNLHRLNLNDMKGWGRGKPFLTAVFLLGALDICGIPPFGGYISKTLLHESIVEYASMLSGGSYFVIKCCEYLFMFTGGLTVAYMTKLFVCIFVEKPAAETAAHGSAKLPLYYSVPLAVCALILPALGIYSTASRYIADISASAMNAEALPALEFFSGENLLGSAISISIGAIVYIFVVRTFMIKDGVYRDFSNPDADIDEKLYKPLVFRILPAIFGSISAFVCELPSYIAKAAMRTASFIAHAVSDLPDALILLSRRTALREVAAKQPDFRHARLPSKIGYAIQKASDAIGIRSRNLDLRFAAAVEAARVTMCRITRNLSFAMIVACIGLCAALIFLIFIN